MNQKYRKIRLIRTVIIDTVIFAAFLFSFAYFHHVRVANTEPVAIPTPAPTATPVPSEVPAVSEETEASQSEETVAVDPNDLLKGKYAERFTDGEIVSDETGYRSKNVSVTVEKRTVGESVCFIADIYIKHLDSFCTAVALEHADVNPGNRKNCMQVDLLSRQVGGIVALSGDNYVFRNAGVVAVRNGMEWDRQFPLDDEILCMFPDGTMETFFSKAQGEQKAYVEDAYARGVRQIWCFGPSLLDDSGNAKTSFRSSVSGRNPRSAVGYYEPGHYCFVLVDGRQKGYSLGMSLEELSALFADLGCSLAYNLDGGETVAIAYRGEIINHPEEAEPRDVSDILYICDPDAGKED